MHKLEAIKILETKLAAIEQEHHAEFAGNEDMRDQADAKAEAKALAALSDSRSTYPGPRRRRAFPHGRSWNVLLRDRAPHADPSARTSNESNRSRPR